jgi:hypothetical protein
MLTYSSYIQTLEDKSASSEYKIGNFSITAIKSDSEDLTKILLVSDTNHLTLH